MLVGFAPEAPEVDEFVLIEMEQALMRTFDATQDQQLLASLDKLIRYHSARQYLATLPIMARYYDYIVHPKDAALLQSALHHIELCCT